MPDQSPQPDRTVDTDRLWAHPEAVLARYGEQGEARREGPSVWEFRRPAIDWYGYALDNLQWSSGEAVLDAGCGAGAYLPHILKRLGPHGRLVGLDFTRAALRIAKRQAPAAHVLAGDVQSLPLADASFDVVLSAHMLYHVPDIRAAAAEFRRVVRPGGVLAIVIGSARDKQELDDLFVAAGGAFPLSRYSERFSADNAHEYLGGIFTQLERRVAYPELVITDPEAVVNYFLSQRTVAEAALKPRVTWASFRQEARRLVADIIEREGAFRVSEEICMILCR